MVPVEVAYRFDGPDGTSACSTYFLDLTALGRQEEWEEPKGRSEAVRSAQPDFAT